MDSILELDETEEEVNEESLTDSEKSSDSEDSLTPSNLTILVDEESPKMKLYKEGLYDPGAGEICAEYISMSDSEEFNHPYYAYPSIKDPGIRAALLVPEKKLEYEVDGQEVYLAFCKEMNMCPVRLFYRSLLDKEINLRYYGVNPKNIAAMCLAMKFNKTVQRLDLTSNFLENNDASYHLGQLLGYRNALKELVLAGCRIGSTGMKNLVVFLHTRIMQLLDLSGNDIKDLGFSYLAHEIKRRAIIRRLNLSHNDLTSESALLLAEALDYNDSITHLDLSRNKFITVRGQTALCRRLGLSKALVELNLSWTSIKTSVGLRILLHIPTLKILNLSNNRLSSDAASTIAQSLYHAKKLEILDLSCNPFTPADALSILHSMRKRVKIKELLMDHIVVDKEFAEELNIVKALKFRKDTKITHGNIIHNYTIPLADLRTITMQRLVKSSQTRNKIKLDIIKYLQEVNKKQSTLSMSELGHTLKEYNSPVKPEVIEGLLTLFRGPKNQKGEKTIKLAPLVDYIRRLWPEKMLPQTPPSPPTPPPLPPSPPSPLSPSPSALKKKSDIKKKSSIIIKKKDTSSAKIKEPASSAASLQKKKSESDNSEKKDLTGSKNKMQTVSKQKNTNEKKDKPNTTNGKKPAEKKGKIVKKK